MQPQTHAQSPSVFINPPHTLAYSLRSLSHTHTNTALLPSLSLFLPIFTQHTHTSLRWRPILSILPWADLLSFLKLQKSDHINEPNAGESGKQTREGGRAACLSACSMATIVHCTFSEPTRAEAISTQILWRDSKPRSERGETEQVREGGGRRSCIKSCLQNALRFRWTGKSNGIRILNRFQGWGVRLTAASIALTNAEKYCGSGKGSQPGRESGRQGVSEPAAPLFTPSSTTNNAAGRKKKTQLCLYQLHTACAWSEY